VYARRRQRACLGMRIEHAEFEWQVAMNEKFVVFRPA
jgi:hypothetical protein